MSERKPVSLSERWRREATRDVNDELLKAAVDTMPTIRQSMVRINMGSIHAELEGLMGSIHEVNIHAPVLPSKIWPQVARVLRRSASMLEALSNGRVPRSFDRLVARIAGEPIFPESRRVTYACTCADPDRPCRHILAVHELFARRLETQPWELLVMRGVDLGGLLEQARRTGGDDLPTLAFGASEEPILFPEGEDGDLESTLSPGQVRRLLGVTSTTVTAALRKALAAYVENDTETTPPPDGDGG
ncbi:MAG: hypothetical protein H6836_01120 [Planctomycetes bacterium]|nr:hypothetical protein [Planctomycetota bacterium]MCB9888144.1 hypothetical protein [Planctomycetota bacterium]